MGKASPKAIFLLLAMVAVILALSARRPEPARLGARNTKLTGLQLPALAGGSWSLDEQHGKVVLLNFWATWCSPCRQETPELVKLHERYRDRGFTVVGVALDDDVTASAPGFVERYRIPYPIVLPGNSAVAADVDGLPTTLLIGRDGRVAETYVGAVTEAGLRADIERVLAAKTGEGAY